MALPKSARLTVAMQAARAAFYTSSVVATTSFTDKAGRAHRCFSVVRLPFSESAASAADAKRAFKELEDLVARAMA